ncbi:hypothetical protein HJC23_002548 [Cyclotella cryptica]|uniref:Acyltransferase n=1 Tax=Cyclotella cryptica TaxID=29204 RepID=A0ABD3QX46_9STRA|eukprot:CCRYP_001406-RA/>CCRYP_001406-RA protein AED:0.32 eAED:0.32 QI:0/-1/0/1/-1/1/1/0/416
MIPSTNLSRRRSRTQQYPFLAKGIETIIPPPPYEACTLADKILVYATSLIIVGSPFWFYGGIIYLYRKWRQYCKLADHLSKNDARDSNGERLSEMKEGLQPLDTGIAEQYARYRMLAKRFGTALAAIILLSIVGPHRNEKVGSMLGVRTWRLWDAWLNYVGFTVLRDHGNKNSETINPEFDIQSSPAMFAFIPHGIFPFGLAFSCLPERGYQNTWGPFRPVVATATKLFPFVRTLISWMGGVDASRSAVSEACSMHPRRIGISPGGIAEMFETFPKTGFHPNDEAALLKDRTGMFKLALQHKLPIVPVYVFGATKMFRRVQLPHFIETLSRMFKISLCLFFGKLGLPIPFRQRLMYVMGRTIFPPIATGEDVGMLEGDDFHRRVQDMHDAFCSEIVRIFDRNKENYGWGHKTLRIV